MNKYELIYIIDTAMEESARKDPIAKFADLVVANDVTEPGAGFGVPTNRVALVDGAGVEQLERMLFRSKPYDDSF